MNATAYAEDRGLVLFTDHNGRRRILPADRRFTRWALRQQLRQITTRIAERRAQQDREHVERLAAIGAEYERVRPLLEWYFARLAARKAGAV